MQLRATRLTAIASAVKRAFNIRSLFAGGAPGVWYDPSDMSTLFQNSAGTTPVTAVEQPVGLMLDKSQGLVLGSELVTNGDFSNGTTGWTANNTATISSVSGGLQIVSTAVNQGTSQVVATTSGVRYKVVITVVSATATYNIGYGSGFGQGQVYDSGVLSGSRTFTFYFVGNGAAATFWFYAAEAGTYLIDNISVKELPGNHAFQATSASRPVLSARYNLLTKTEQFDDAVWAVAFAGGGATSPTKGTTTGARPDGTVGTINTVTFPSVASGQASFIFQNTGASQLNIGVTESIYVRVASGSATVFLNVEDVGAAPSGGNFIAGTAQTVTTEWTRISLSGTRTASVSNAAFVLGFDTRANAAQTNAAPITVQVWGADFRPTNQSTLPYQRVNTSTDYNTTGFLPYLRFDGVDDSLSTNSISFTSTDKMSVFAGVRKLSDAAFQILAELSSDYGVNNGTFVASTTWDAANCAFISRGTFFANASTASNSFPAPRTLALTGLGDISGDRATLRVNGAQVAQNTADQGTGNYGNYPLYIGSRAGSSLRFNGQMYSMIIVGKAVTAGELSSTEKFVASKTGVTL